MEEMYGQFVLFSWGGGGGIVTVLGDGMTCNTLDKTLQESGIKITVSTTVRGKLGEFGNVGWEINAFLQQA